MRLAPSDDDIELTTPTDVDTQDEKMQTLRDVDIDNERNGITTNITSVPPVQETNDLKIRISENPETNDGSETPEEANEGADAIGNSHKDSGDSVTQEKESAFDWMVLLCAFGSNLTFGMDFTSFSVFYPCLMEYFQATSAQVGWCLSIETFVTAILCNYFLFSVGLIRFDGVLRHRPA